MLQFIKGFYNTNLNFFRKFRIEFPASDLKGLNSDIMRNLFPGYQQIQIRGTGSDLLLCKELFWTHFRFLMRAGDPKAGQE
jgi:hypothetical protein